MTTATRSGKRVKREVNVFVDEDRPQGQPETFSLCPLGVQFYSEKPMAEFQLLDVDVEAKNAAGKPVRVNCKGAVVRCQREPQPNRYRIWVKFVDLPEKTRESIRCTARNGQHLCSYCENF